MTDWTIYASRLLKQAKRGYKSDSSARFQRAIDLIKLKAQEDKDLGVFDSKDEDLVYLILKDFEAKRDEF